jgi:mRNA-degrading endonuclease RelE of RelBE toxin-antitoxin system
VNTKSLAFASFHVGRSSSQAFVQSRRFTARLEDLAKESADDVLLGIENDLLHNPERGPIISGTGGIRKARAADPRRGKGKRGGFRYMYYYLEQDGQILLLLIFSKNEQDNLTAAQKKWLREHREEL